MKINTNKPTEEYYRDCLLSLKTMCSTCGEERCPCLSCPGWWAASILEGKLAPEKIKELIKEYEDAKEKE